MKRLICVQTLGLLTLLFGSYRTSAQFVLLTDNRNIGAFVNTNGVSVTGQTNFPSAAFTNFNSTANSGVNFGTGNNISSGVSQTSSLMSSAISMTSTVNESYNFFNSPDEGYAYGENTFEVTFSVPVPTKIRLSGYVAINASSYAPITPATLTSTHYGTIATAPGVADSASTNWSYSGILQPDTYELTGDDNIILNSGEAIGEGMWQNMIALVAVPPPQITALQVTNNTVQLTVSATGGSTNAVLMTTNLANPVSGWLAISTNVAGTNGVFQVTNSIPAGQDTGFYLISSP